MTLPDLESLRCFQAAANQLHFRLAARTVGLSPAAFGDRIRRLEEQLGAKLFERTTRSVGLTPAGERLRHQADRCLREALACAEAVEGTVAPQPFDLTVGTRFELGMSWLTPALGELEQRRPDRRLNLVFGDTPALLHALRRAEIDCFISSARIAAAGLAYGRLHEERYVFVGRRSLVRRLPLARCEDAAEHTLIELNATLPLFRYFLDARPGHEVWSFARTQYLGTIAPVRMRVLDGAGVAVLPHYFVADDLARGRLVELMAEVVMPVDWFRLIWRADHPRREDLHTLAGELGALPLR